jgi:hypothetical protein
MRGRRILGAPNGREMAWLLAEHKAVLEEKTVHQGTVFKD